MLRNGRYLLAGVLLAGFLVGIVFILRLKQGKLPALATDFPRAKGPVEAPVQIIEYSDFQCPACQTAQSTLLELFIAYPEKIRLVFQHFPLEGHLWSPLAHRAAECAAEQNQFWSYHDQLYAEQAVWSKSPQAPIETFLHYAKEGGLGLDEFARCLGEGKVDRKLREERVAGGGLGVRSTPSFFVNGKLVIGTGALRAEVKKIINPNDPS